MAILFNGIRIVTVHARPSQIAICDLTFRLLPGGSSMKDTDMEKSGTKSASKPTVAPTQGEKGKPTEGTQHRSGTHADKHDKDANAKHAQKK